MKRIILAAALAASAAVAEEKAAAPAAPAKMEMPKPPEQMSVEKWFVGSWSCKGQQHAGPMGPEMKTASKLDMKLELAGFWLQVKGTFAGAGPMKGKEMFEGFASWDGTQHARYDFDMNGMTKLTSKGWEGDKLVFNGEMVMGGQKVPAQETITKKSDASFTTHLETADKDGKMAVTLEETCTKKN